MRALIVDDDEEILEMLTTYVRVQGFEVFAALDAKAAMELFLAHKPDLVLLDVMLPGKDGLTLLKEMKAISDLPKYVMVTAYKGAEKVVKAYRNGAVDCILKPIDWDYLGKLIKRVKDDGAEVSEPERLHP